MILIDENDDAECRDFEYRCHRQLYEFISRMDPTIDASTVDPLHQVEITLDILEEMPGLAVEHLEAAVELHFDVTPAIPRERFNLADFSPEEKARLEALLMDPDFQDCTIRREQMSIAVKNLRSFVNGHRMTFEAIGRFFGSGSAVIFAQARLANNPRRQPGRPSLLSQDLKEWLVNLVNSRFHERKPISYSELLDLLQYDHHFAISADTLRHIVKSMDSIKTVIGIPMEAERVAVDPGEILAWFDRLRNVVDGVPREFVFNMDETGCSDQSDSRELRVIAPIAYRDPSVRVPYDRHSKRCSFVACIAADGFRMKPFAIVHRVTAEKEIKYYGYGDSNVQLAYQPNAFMTRPLFELWARTVFFPTIEQRRQDLGYRGRVVLIMDGLGSHHTDQFMGDCEARNIQVLFLIPHSSDQIQPLDVLTFALMKQGFSASKFDRLVNAQSNKVVRMLGAWFGASAPHHNVEAFMNIGLIPEERDGQFVLKVVPEKARRVRGISLDDQPARPSFPPDAQRRFRLATGP
jgi:hypothetical protein